MLSWRQLIGVWLCYFGARAAVEIYQGDLHSKAPFAIAGLILYAGWLFWKLNAAEAKLAAPAATEDECKSL